MLHPMTSFIFHKRFFFLISNGNTQGLLQICLCVCQPVTLRCYPLSFYGTAFIQNESTRANDIRFHHKEDQKWLHCILCHSRYKENKEDVCLKDRWGHLYLTSECLQPWAVLGIRHLEKLVYSFRNNKSVSATFYLGPKVSCCKALVSADLKRKGLGLWPNSILFYQVVKAEGVHSQAISVDRKILQQWKIIQGCLRGRKTGCEQQARNVPQRRV